MTGNDTDFESLYLPISRSLLEQLHVIIDKYQRQGAVGLRINSDTVSVIAAQYVTEIGAASETSFAKVGVETRAATLCKLVARFRPIWATSDEGDHPQIRETKLLINEISALFVLESVLQIDPGMYDEEGYRKFRHQLIYVLRFHSPTTEMLRTLALVLRMKTRREGS